MLINKYFELIEKKANWLIVLFAVFFLTWFAWPLAQLGTFHLRVVEAFNTDEGEFLWPVMQAFSRGDINIGRYDYGLLYYNIGLVFAYLANVVIEIDSQKMIQIFRMESFLFVILTSYLLYDYGKRFVNTWFGLGLFFMSLLGSQTMLVYGTMLHPDTCQAFFIVLSVYGLSRFVKSEDWYWVFISSASAGLAFSTKYAGVALLPLIFYILIFRGQGLLRQFDYRRIALVLSILSLFWAILLDAEWIALYITQKAEIVESLYVLIHFFQGLCFLVGLFALLSWKFQRVGGREIVQIVNHRVLLVISNVSIFILAFIIGSPQAAYKFNFLNGFIYVTNLHKDGHWFRDDSGLLGWFKLLSQNEVLGLLWIGLALLGLLLLFFWSKNRDPFSPLWLPFFWIIIFLAVVVFRVKSKFAHYLIPIIPFVIFYAVLSLNYVLEKTLSKRETIRYFVSFGLLLIITGLLLFKASEYKALRIYKYENSETMAAGYWLEKNIKEDVFILADKYCYIPAIVQIKHISVFGVVKEHFEQFEPDVLVINKRIYEHFLNLEDKEGYLHGKDVFEERNKIYTSLLADEYEGYHLVKDFGDVKVYFKE